MAYRKTLQVVDQLAAKRLRILAAAQRLITEGGFNEAPISAIAALSDVGTGTIYRHFGSKSKLLAEIVEAVSSRELVVLAAAAKADGSATERLERVIRLFCKRALLGRRLTYAMMVEPLDPEIDAIRMRARRGFAQICAGLIEQGMRARELPKQRAATSAACIAGACVEALIGPLATSARSDARASAALLQDIVSFSLAAVGAPRRCASRRAS